MDPRPVIPHPHAPSGHIQALTIAAAHREAFRRVTLDLAGDADEARRLGKDRRPIDDEPASVMVREGAGIRFTRSPDQPEHRPGRLAPIDPAVLLAQ